MYISVREKEMSECMNQIFKEIYCLSAYSQNGGAIEVIEF
jgi:hypothetical protein